MNEHLRKYLEEDGEKPEIVVTDVKHCARCRQDHKDLLFKALTHPVVDSDGTVWEWYTLCPVNHEPILLMGKGKS